MAHADDIGKYEGPICDLCRTTMFVGTCTHRPRKFPEMPPIVLSEADLERLADLLKNPPPMTEALKKLAQD